MISFDDIPLKNISGVLIDLDNTLYAYEPAHQAAFRAVFAALPFPCDFDAFSVEYRKARTDVTERLKPQAACRSRFFAFQALAEARKMPCPYSFAAAMDTLYWESFIAAMIMDPKALSFLKKCKTAHIPVCLVSDMTALWQVKKLEKLGLTDFIPLMVTSEEVGAEKPDPRMFQTALRKLNLTPDQVIMIGDDNPKDIQGAQALGITSYLVHAA